VPYNRPCLFHVPFLSFSSHHCIIFVSVDHAAKILLPCGIRDSMNTVIRYIRSWGRESCHYWTDTCSTSAADSSSIEESCKHSGMCQQG